MNAKKAKFLRKQAEAITIGADKVAYTSTTVKRQEEILVPDSNGVPKPLIQEVNKTTVLLQNTCTREVYKDMKKVYKRISNSGVSYA